MEGEVAIKTSRKEIVCENVDWIQLARDRAQCRSVCNTAVKLWILQRRIIYH
jgi:hypothetical protein